MNTNTLIAIVVIIVIVIGGFFLLQKAPEGIETETQNERAVENAGAEGMMEQTEESAGGAMEDSGNMSESEGEEDSTSDEGEVSSEVPVPGSGDVDEMVAEEDPVETTNTTIAYTSNGYSPKTVTISVGDTVTFVNESGRDTWPASDIHPTHTLYPDSAKSKCGTAEEDSIFDSCGGVAPGDSWSFTFTEAGAWGFHDHLRANHKGTVTVE